MVGVVAAWSTTSVCGVALEGAYFVASSGVKTAPTWCPPGGRFPSAGLVACPLLTVTGAPRSVPSTENWTAPSWAPPSVAVAVTSWPKTDSSGLRATDSDVGASATETR